MQYIGRFIPATFQGMNKLKSVKSQRCQQVAQ